MACGFAIAVAAHCRVKLSTNRVFDVVPQITDMAKDMEQGRQSTAPLEPFWRRPSEFRGICAERAACMHQSRTPGIGVPTARSVWCHQRRSKAPQSHIDAAKLLRARSRARGSPTQHLLPRLVLDATSAGFGPRVSFRDFCDICFLQLGGSVGLNMTRFSTILTGLGRNCV